MFKHVFGVFLKFVKVKSFLPLPFQMPPTFYKNEIVYSLPWILYEQLLAHIQLAISDHQVKIL
jgi:hypothetical protein